MKKLLLILICLFVSFEVKSNPDDLTGLKLLCNYKDYSEGLEFYKIKEYKVNKVMVYYLNEETGLLSKKSSLYHTSPIEITIVKCYSKDICHETNINRQNPKTCKKFSGDIELFFEQKSEKLIKKLKSKQKF